ncbi:Berardinelli-Seip congenital lipodystrophy 2 (seipin) [Podila epicladia]|nr:Berardinelli-Seip congenital lipodystrophy 2 (seipin) [Podila epicladia]KAG0099708.1 Berardinelli-Seip congenital lipodystrophy 2 (seipin) [Podila epicladia]
MVLFEACIEVSGACTRNLLSLLPPLLPTKSASSSQIAAFLLSPFKNLLEPYVSWLVRFVTSSATKRRVVQALVACIVIGLLTSLALLAYLVFYWIYIPQARHVGQIHFQHGILTHGGVTPGPFAKVEFPKSLLSPGYLRGGQGYDISVDLAVPSSTKNLDVGNFMVTVKLLNNHGDIIAKSSRPAILTYYSLPVRVMRSLLRAVPLVLWWSREEQQLKVELMKSFVEDSNNPVARVLVEVSSPDLRIYKATLHLDAHFRGLRHLMYYNRITTALIFMFGFVVCETIFAISAWVLLTRWFGESSEVPTPTPTPTPRRDNSGSIYEKATRSLLDKEPGPDFREGDQLALDLEYREGDLQDAEFSSIPVLESRTDNDWLEESGAAQTLAHGVYLEGTNDLHASKILRRRQRMPRDLRLLDALEMEGHSSTYVQEFEPNARSTALP